MKTKQIALTAMFAALTMVLGPLVVVVPFTPIPFTLALIPIYLSGALLPKHYALYSQVVYLLAGMVGLPVFSQFRSGVAVLAGPTGGYLIAYPLMAFLIAFLLEKTHSHGYVPYFLTMLCALALCYLFGSLWFMVDVGKIRHIHGDSLCDSGSAEGRLLRRGRARPEPRTDACEAAPEKRLTAESTGPSERKIPGHSPFTGENARVFFIFLCYWVLPTAWATMPICETSPWKSGMVSCWAASLSAVLGLGCTSIIRPSAPAAIPASASGAT